MTAMVNPSHFLLPVDAPTGPLAASPHDADLSVSSFHEKDILCGRDKLSFQHPGNRWLRNLIHCYRERYQNAPLRDLKTRITCEIASIVESEGGRFLKYDNDLCAWIEVDDAGIKDKISHALRSAKAPKQRNSINSPRSPRSQENATFQRLMATQQVIFQNLLDNNAKSAKAHDDTNSWGHL